MIYALQIAASGIIHPEEYGLGQYMFKEKGSVGPLGDRLGKEPPTDRRGEAKRRVGEQGGGKGREMPNQRG